MKRWVSCAAAMIGLLACGSARADAAQDVKDLRAGQLPLRYEWLGWDSASAAHFRTLTCSGGGTTSCSAAFVKQAADVPPKATTLLSVNEVYCGTGTCEALDAATVRKFVAIEKATLAGLPTTTMTAREKDPRLVFGSVAGDATKLEVRARDVSKGPDDFPHLQVELVLRGKGGASETLGVLDSRVYRLESSKIRDAFLAADGKTAAIVVETHVGVMCWSFEGLSTVGSSLPRHKASLANTIGFVAWKSGDMTGALAGFTEATTLDATLGLGWYNRAAVESRTGDVAGAKTSFDAAVALDSSFASRACKDPDFAKLRTAEPSLFHCR